MAISLIVGLISARYLGPSNYGLIHYASAYTAFFASICTLGIQSILVKELVDHPTGEGTVLGTALMLRTAAGFLSCLAVVAISAVADAGEKTTRIVVALSCLGMILQAAEVFRYRFQAEMRAKITAAATLAAYTLTALYRVVLLIRGKSVAWFALATAVDGLCLGLLLWLCYRKSGGDKLCFSWTYGRALLAKSHHFILPGLMVAVYTQMDKIMLKQMLGQEAVGYYSTALSLCDGWCFVLTALIESMYPTIMAAFSEDPSQFDRKNKQLYRCVFYLSASVALLLGVGAVPIVRLLYGREYLPAAAPLRVLTWCTVFAYLGVARNGWIVCKNRQYCLKYLYCAAAAVNLGLNFLLIPRWGATGAAVASLAAQVLTAVVMPLLRKDLRENAVLMVQAVMFR